jgi:O-antigen ligase
MRINLNNTVVFLLLFLIVMIEIDLRFIGLDVTSTRIISITSVFIISISHFRKFRKKRGLVVNLISIYLVWLLITIILSGELFSLMTSFLSFVMMVLSLYILSEKESLEKILIYFIKIIFTLCVISLILIPITDYVLQDESFFRLKGVFIHAQRLSIYSNISMALILLSYNIRNKLKLPTVYIIVFILTIILSGARLFTTINLLTIILIWNIKYARVRYATIILIPLILFAIISQFDFLISLISRGTEDIVELTGRTRLWEDLIILIQQDPWLGRGFGYFKFNEIQYSNWIPPHGHNLWLHSSYETGIIGAMIITAILMVALIKSFSLNKYKYISMYICIYILISSIFGIFIGYIVNPVYSLFLIIIIKLFSYAKTHRSNRILQSNG